MEWIKCSERMPEIGQQVLMGHFRYKRWWYCGGEVDGSDDGIFVDYGVDGEEMRTDCYWMPIPPQPKEE